MLAQCIHYYLYLSVLELSTIQGLVPLLAIIPSPLRSNSSSRWLLITDFEHLNLCPEVHMPRLLLFLSIIFGGLYATLLLMICCLLFQSTSNLCTNNLQALSEPFSSLSQWFHLPSECLCGILAHRLLIAVFVELEHQIVVFCIKGGVGFQSGFLRRFKSLQGVLAELSVLC